MSSIIEQGSDLATILGFVIQIITILITAIGAGAIGYNKGRKKFNNKKEKRLFDNIQRPIALLPSSTDSLEIESHLLDAVDFFETKLLPADIRSLDEITAKYRLVIIRYEDSENFWHIFNALADRVVPMVIYSKPAEIQQPALKKIQERYSRYALCNTSLRLISDVFAIMSTYPENE